MTVPRGVFAMMLLVATLFSEGARIASASDNEETFVPPQSQEVHLAPNGVVMPLGRILLVRRGTEYCALKFIRFWTGKTERDRYAEYESYCPREASDNPEFRAERVEKKRETASFSRLFGFGRLAFSLGNKEVKCGSLRLFWSGKGAVYFFARDQSQGDHGIELAPTPWSDISQVNISDPNVRWYRYNETRKRVNIPVDKLWPDSAGRNTTKEQ